MLRVDQIKFNYKFVWSFVGMGAVCQTPNTYYMPGSLPHAGACSAVWFAGVYRTSILTLLNTTTNVDKTSKLCSFVMSIIRGKRPVGSFPGLV